MDALFRAAFVLLLLWVAGLVASYRLGGTLHIFLLLVIAAALIRLLQAGSRHDREPSRSGTPGQSPEI